MKLKKWLVAILSCVTIGAIGVGFSACEKEETGGGSFVNEEISSDLQYVISEGGTYYSVVGVGMCEDRNIVVPATYKGLPVKEIMESAFSGQFYIASVKIPDGVMSIGVSAFSNCRSLKSVVIPESVTSIGICAFQLCSSLTEIVIPDGVTIIGYKAFNECSSLTSVVIPDRVTSIDSEAFSYCSSLTSVVIPDRVTSIGSGAFSYCDSLMSITFEGTVKEWNAISKDWNWNNFVPATEVVCSDGKVAL
ncbi:MAG: leucine-rich repeat domain-containing protein [Clostridia bacterium]|nr:leucine-rich repeat domain-containing protein [Clostridia bacterium]